MDIYNNMSKDITKEQIEELYINQNLTSHECQDILNISRGHWKRLVKKLNIKKSAEIIQKQKEETCIKHYGTRIPLQSDIVKEKARKTCQLKYGVDNPQQNDLVKAKTQATCLERYGVENILKAPIVKNKIKIKLDNHIPQSKRIETMKKNNTLHSSNDQIIIKSLLEQKFDKVETEFYSERYPWNCDFYIPSLDLFIEYQGTWQHGKKPYDKDDPECKALLANWYEKYKKTNKESYIVSFKRYVKQDPLKRATAKNNNLNWIEFFTLNEFLLWYETLETLA